MIRAEGRVWLLDSSAMTEIKTKVRGAAQWKLFRRLEDLVETGNIAFPKQIKVEVTDIAHPDAPGVWADGVWPAMKHPQEPEPVYLAKVMSSPAAAVVDPNKTREDGDPYLIALALQLIDEGHDVCVVTNDTRTNPTRISLAAACDHVDVPWCDLDEFLSSRKAQP